MLSPSLQLRTIPSCLSPCWNGKDAKAFQSQPHQHTETYTAHTNTHTHMSRQTFMCVDTQEYTDIHRAIDLHIQT